MILERPISHTNPTHRFAHGIVRWRFVLAVIGAVVAAVAYPVSTRVDFDRSIAAMFADNDPALVAYRELERSFGGNAVVMLVYEDDAFETDAGLARNEDLSAAIETIPGVAGVLSPAVLNGAVEKIRPASLFSASSSLFKKSDPVARGFMELFAGYTHSADRSRAAVVAMLQPDHSPETIEAMQAIANELPQTLGPSIGNVSLVGEPVLVHDGFALIERDGARLAWLTIALLSVVVLVALRDGRVVVLAGIVIGWSVTVTKALMWTAGIELSLVSTILTAIVTVVTVTAVLHLGVRYRKGLRRGKVRGHAVAAAIGGLAAPIFWTCATDAAGFAALSVSRILPVQQFGIMIAIASIAVFVAIVLFAPVCLMVPAIAKPSAAISRGVLRRAAMRSAAGAIRRWPICLAVTAAMIAVIAFGLTKTEVETSFLSNFRDDSTIAMDYDAVEKNFGGAGVWDVVLDAPAELTEDFMDDVRQLEDDLRAIDVDGAKLTKVISLADADSVALKIRLLRLVSPSTRLSGMQSTMPVFFSALLATPPADAPAEPPQKFRIMLRSEEQLDAARKTALIAQVQSVVRASEVGRAGDVGQGGRVTGYYVMMAKLVSQIVGDQWRCFAASGVLVWLLLIAATRSLRLATAAVVPNLLPVFLVLALVGIAGEKINMGAAMIAAVSVGLSIDGSVHFLAAYQRLRSRGHDAGTSATHAAGGIGAAVMLATVALVIGFGAMTTSEFVPTATFGTLVAAALVLGTVVNLTLLPAIVAKIDR
jgi:uncharacterized protein